MQVSLRARILLFVAAINALVFGSGLYYLSARVQEDRDKLVRDFSEVLLYTLQPTVDPGGRIRVAEILRWPNWSSFDDALIVSANWEVARDGSIRPQGAFLNPVGRARRASALDEREVLRAIAEVVSSRVSMPVAGGIAIPVLDSEGRVWGGCWFSVSREAARSLLVQLLPWFLVSTALLTLGTFAMLRRFVLEPVEALADGARRLGEGELSARLSVPARKDELAELIRGFNQMAETVEGFNARLAREVEIATENARRAENAAMTQRRLAATGELAAGIAHEVNNPLGGLINAVEALEKKELPPAKRAQYLGLLRHGLERIQRTVGQVLRLAPRAPQSVPLSLVDPVVDAVGLVAWRARNQSVVIAFHGEDLAGPGAPAVLERARALPRIEGDPAELAQALLNLLVNALDALEARGPSEPGAAGGGRIDLALERRGDELILSVQDDGPGVSAELLPRVADLFFTTKDAGKGTGLGLAIVHNVVAAHRGRVLLSNAKSRGLRVELAFPLARGDDRARGAA